MPAKSLAGLLFLLVYLPTLLQLGNGEIKHFLDIPHILGQLVRVP